MGYNKDNIDWSPKYKTMWVYEIMSIHGQRLQFYFSTAKQLNKFRNLTREHSSKFIMPDKSNELFGIRESTYSERVDVNAPYTKASTTLNYYGCKDDVNFHKTEKYWKEAKENVERKRMQGIIPPEGVNMTDWVKMTKSQKKKCTEQHCGV
jgi:hypothetical protein